MMNLEPGSRSSMTDSIMSKAATMEIPINSNGDTRTSEDDSLEQIHWSLERKDLQQVMVSGPNLNETSIVSGGYGGSTEGIIPTGSIKGPAILYNEEYFERRCGNAPKPERRSKSRDFPPSHSAAARISCQPDRYPAPSMHHSHSNPSMMSEEATRGIAVEKFDSVKKWSINTYKDEFGYNAETQKLLCKNGETLLGAINFFVSSINTLVNKTMEDTLMTIKMYENARLEYDAYRTDLEELSAGPRDAAAMMRIEFAQQEYQIHRDKYERLRSDVTIKLKFLEENKVKVMHKQLLLFHNAISAYFAGNQQQLEQTLRQFNVKLKRPGSDRPSWLEEQ
ncbi:arfaptin-2a isoform X7 [Ictalurus punctatus]|uniref:Arfaptin-2a isoform X7 n=1 Tax=Ictalurus punctatus TaxID=7998 RepID=A0A2D0SY22_ICTPU|nr:arfaptin-2a isoform X7 [Ictalurus punctatus]